MKRVWLNHTLNKDKGDWPSTAILIIGGCLCAFSIFYLHQIKDQSRSLKQALLIAKTQQKSNVVAKAQSNTLDTITTKETAEINIVSMAIKEIMLPWSTIFKSLETAHQDDIKVLTIEPDTKIQSVHIVAIALDTKNMMAYIQRLSHQAFFKQVNLYSTEAVVIEGLTATKFELNLRW